MNKKTNSFREIYCSVLNCFVCTYFSRECPTSTSTEEEAIQGMLSMAGLHYTTCLPDHTQSTDCTDKRTSLQEQRSYPRSRHKDRQPSQSHKTIECGKYLN